MSEVVLQIPIPTSSDLPVGSVWRVARKWVDPNGYILYMAVTDHEELCPFHCDCKGAAAEIERLATDFRAAQTVNKAFAEENNNLRAEIERLRAELAEVNRLVNVASTSLHQAEQDRDAAIASAKKAEAATDL
jgi:hypothetical protein